MPHHLKSRSDGIIFLKILQRLSLKPTLRIKSILFNTARVKIIYCLNQDIFKSEEGVTNNYIRAIGLNQTVPVTPDI